MKDKFYFDRHETRMKVLEQFSMAHAENWQSNTTPLWVARDMTRLVEDTPDLRYVALFNIEFLEALVFDLGVPRDRIMFMADNKYEAALAMTVYGVKTFELPVDVRIPKRAIELVAEKITKAFYKGGTMPVTNNLVVFGNPPYQAEDGGHSKSAKPIYHLFVEAVIDCLSPRFFSFIIPSRWMAGGKGLGGHRARMRADRRVRVIKHFSGEQEVFKEVSIKGGVNYFLWDRGWSGKCNFNGVHRSLNEYDIILSDNDAVSILDKVLSIHPLGQFINETCLGSKPFGLRASFKNWVPSGIPCYTIRKERRYVSSNDFLDSNNVLNSWKVCTSEAIGPNSMGHFDKFGMLFVAGPGAVCTETYIVVNSFSSEVEAEKFIVYMKTRFFRFMLGLRVVTQHVNKAKFSWVPDMKDYTRVWTDADLYKKFGLTSEEIAYIESKIKEIA